MKLILDWIGYRLLLILPYWIGASTKHAFGRWCIQRAGNWTYRDKR